MENQDAKGLRICAGEIQESAGGFDVNRWAQLLADGEKAWPVDLPHEISQSLFLRVNYLRRRRLMQLIAKAIASDIYSAAEQVKEDT